MKIAQKAFASYLEEGEELLDLMHHNIFTIFKPIGKITALFIILPGILWYILDSLSFIWVVFIAIGLLKISSILLSWYFNALLITSASFVNIEWKDLFNKQATRLEYSQAENFSYAVVGVFNTIFRFGDIIIDKTGGSQLILKGVFKPKTKTQLLTKIQSQMLDTQLKQDHNSLKDVLTNVLREHIKEHGVTITDE